MLKYSFGKYFKEHNIRYMRVYVIYVQWEGLS